MEIGLIGLGKMGFNLALNMNRNKHKVIAFDLNTQARNTIREKGISTGESLEDTIKKLPNILLLHMAFLLKTKTIDKNRALTKTKSAPLQHET